MKYVGFKQSKRRFNLKASRFIHVTTIEPGKKTPKTNVSNAQSPTRQRKGLSIIWGNQLLRVSQAN
jgi:hypothetical protein